MNDDTLPTINDVEAAARRIEGSVHRTPVMSSERIDESLDAELFFKCENLQRTGAFKIRGATNAVELLSDEEARRGVATHSSGNHGAALAAAAQARGIPAYIVVPKGAVASKLANIEYFGGKVIRCEPTQADREATLEKVVEETGANVIHPYNDARIICGQGTAGLELLDEVIGLDMMIVPVGGGGLISGCATVAKAQRPDLLVIGAEPAGADDTFRSLEQGSIIDRFDPDTVADGLRAKVGELTFRIIRERVDRVVTVTDDEILDAMQAVWAAMKIIIEPSSATVLAAARKLGPGIADRRIGLILSGGNADLERIAFCGLCQEKK